MKLFHHTDMHHATLIFRIYRWMLDFTFGCHRTEQDPGLAIALYFSRSANMDRFVEFSITIGYFMIWFGVGPSNITNDSRQWRVLTHDHGFHHWDLDCEKFDPIGHTAFVFKAPQSAPEYVFILSRPCTWTLFDSKHITDGVEMHKLNGWRALSFQEVHDLIEADKGFSCITKDGEERYDPFRYVRVQDFLKYLN